MKFAFIIMGDFDVTTDQAYIAGGTAQIHGVATLAEACEVGKSLQDESIDCIELCGAFEKAGAQAVIDATHGKIPVGYIVHTPEQDDLFAQTFGN